MRHKDGKTDISTKQDKTAAVLPARVSGRVRALNPRMWALFEWAARGRGAPVRLQKQTVFAPRLVTTGRGAHNKT